MFKQTFRNPAEPTANLQGLELPERGRWTLERSVEMIPFHSNQMKCHGLGYHTYLDSTSTLAKPKSGVIGDSSKADNATSDVGVRLDTSN